MSTPTNYKTADWNAYELLAETAPTSITWASRGGDGSGKSHFACTAPTPIFVAGFDPYGMQRVAREVRHGKEIRIGRYGFNCAEHGEARSAVSAAAEAIWNRFVADYRTALKYMSGNGKAHRQRGTILWDREDLAWELLRYASFGGQKNDGSKTAALDYGDLNAEYVSLIQEARAAGVNLGLLQGLTANWVAKFDPNKGKMVNYEIGTKPDGFKKLADHVDITIDHRWDAELKEYTVRFQKFPNKEQKDQEYPNVTFVDMATFAYPDTTEEEWR